MRLVCELGGPWIVGFLFLGIGFHLGCDFSGYLNEDFVYVTARVLNLRERPTTQASVLKALNRGEKLKILENRDMWLRVKTDEGVSGWVYRNYVGDSKIFRAAINRNSALKDTKLERKWAQSGSGKRRVPRFTIDRMLDGLPGEIEIERVGPIGSQDRSMGVTPDGQVVVEFWGDPEKLSCASIMVSVLNVSDKNLFHNSALVVRFVRNAVPKWSRETMWMVKKLRELASKDTGTGGFTGGGKKVRFEFVKALGSVRISINNKI